MGGGCIRCARCPSLESGTGLINVASFTSPIVFNFQAGKGHSHTGRTHTQLNASSSSSGLSSSSVIVHWASTAACRTEMVKCNMNQMGLSPSASCGAANQTTQHIASECPLHICNGDVVTLNTAACNWFHDLQCDVFPISFTQIMRADCTFLAIHTCINQRRMHRISYLAH